MSAVVVVGTQWGDEGKGETIDQPGQDVGCVVKFNGDNDARHTVVIDGEKLAFHFLLADILAPGATLIIGSDVVVNLEVLLNKIAEITSRGKDVSGLLISTNAYIIPSYNRVLDRTTERLLGARQLSTTGRGVRPTYVGKMSRVGIRIQDLFDESILRQKMHSTLNQESSLSLEIFSRVTIDADAIAGELLPYTDRVRPMVVDCSLVLNHALNQGKTVLFGVGQATMLDIDHDTYSFAISSSPTVGGACTGIDVGPTRIDSVIGVVKAYTTCVEERSFPAELLDDMGERLRTEGGEYGVITGRPRRCGWHDVAVTCYVAYVSGLTNLVVTKLDILAGHKTIPVCVTCSVDGIVTRKMPLTRSGFYHVVSVYKELPDWSEDISEVHSFADLPRAVQGYVLRVGELARCCIFAIGVGLGREATIPRRLLIG